jgi:MerR family transcriptional regulator, light-induced transcriptional regulator
LSNVRHMAEVQHSIKVAARKTGLSPHVIRVWERRYDAVSPDRTDSNRRLYSEAEIERLQMLRNATLAGHSISHIAKLPIEQLRQLSADVVPATPPSATNSTPPTAFLVEATAAIRTHDTAKLESVLAEATLRLGFHGLLEQMVAPFATHVGELWAEGKLTAAHEHYASAVIRNFLIRNSQPFAPAKNAPTLVVATPAGQLHELGAVMVAAAANNLGWRVVYLGTALPALEIAGAALSNQARAVALSIIFPADDPNLPGELQTLRRHLPATVALIVGGRSADGYAETLRETGAHHAHNLTEFSGLLEQLRKAAR